MVDDPVRPVKHGDIVQLIHGTTSRALNRSVYSLTDGTYWSVPSLNEGEWGHRIANVC